LLINTSSTEREWSVQIDHSLYYTYKQSETLLTERVKNPDIHTSECKEIGVFLKPEAMNHYSILANCTEEQASQLACLVLQNYPNKQVKLLSGPRQGLIMLRVRETVANSRFNAGEILVTEVRLELNGQFGFGMIIGDNTRHAMAIALVDAALRKEGPLATQLRGQLAALEHTITQDRQRLQALIATTQVNFERM
jgi:alpha-D-ribose 1-methylphosphonate 5-triphosphate synthase subunit PhnG